MTSYQLLLDRALRLLALRDHSEAELRRKLRPHGVRADVEQVIAQLKSRGYLDDQKYAVARAGYLRRRKQLGNLRITAELQRLGVDGTIIRLVLERLEDEAPEAASLREVVRARVAKTGAPRSRGDLKRLFDHAVRLGYPPGAVREELEPFFSGLESFE